MRVLMVTRETAPDRRYGLGRSLEPIVAGLRSRGIDARYYCQDDLTAAQLASREATWQRMSGMAGLRNSPPRLALARAWLERLQVGGAAGRVALAEGYTHVHAHDPWIAVGVSRALRGAGTQVRWGVTEHGFGSYATATRLDGLEQSWFTQRVLRRIEKRVLARADWVVAPTKACLVELGRELGERTVPAHWRAVAHARPAVAPLTAQTRQSSRAVLGWNDDEFVVLAIGRLVPLKCFDKLIAACAKQDGNSKLVILGGGDAAPLEAVAQQCGMAGRVQFAFVDDVTPYLHGADVYASTSSTESFGLANLEAMCAGLPCICNPAGGVPEVVGDGAWLVGNDVDALAAAIGALASDAALRHDWAGRALARAASWPGPDKITQDYVDVYQATRRAARA